MTIGILVSLNIAESDNTTNKNIYEKLKEQKYLVVDDHETSSNQWAIHFDLPGERFFDVSRALSDGAVYGLPKNKKPKQIFKRAVANNLSIFQSLKLSNQEIKESNYIIERDILPLLDETEFKNEFPTNFEALYLNAGLKKVRITFNKKFLPVKVEGYYDNKKGKRWEFLRKLSYPYKNEVEFNRKLNESIQGIKEEEETYRKEREIEQAD